MNGIPNLTETIQAIGDPTRIELLTVMIDNRYYTVTELSKRTLVSLSTTSYHLKKLSSMGWIDTYKRGKNVYYGLINNDIANIIEQLMTISAPKKVNSYNQKIEYLEIKKARTCYSHLAGKFGVGLLDYMIENRYLEKKKHNVSVTENGKLFFRSIGIENAELLNSKLCMDWSERRFHLAGDLGLKICAVFLQKGWIINSTKNRSIILSMISPEWLRVLYKS
ncbi:winged helix-turn-helix transcriptional regulator [Leuconostoc mesenteroides]|uniref:ArsR/SmtB family transcription factor n=1 Tax=Leuconostoc mesenteroides TaxID=1245 RepID=UPI001B8C6BAD|nr:winged helix-turn-helix domain-containing protein [Leuconostoc mesenteroides]MBS0943235.1 winged helix-turn-helix transcriptional regulator [Leuconostoc mesenteroides]